MSVLQIWIFVGLLTFILAKAFLRPQRFLEFPYFMAATFAVFIFPQVISLKRFPGATPLESLTPVMVMTNLCLAGCYLGYLLPPNRWIAKHGSTPVYLNRLFHAGVAFILVSFFFDHLIGGLSEEARGGTTWTGKVTIYHFFSQLVYPGLAISLLTAITHRSFIAWAFTFLAMVVPLKSIFLAGRREGAALFVLTIALTLYYHRRQVPPRALIAAALGFAMIFIPATGTFRGALSTGGFEAVRQLRLVENFKRFLNEESVLELRNAAVLIYVTSTRGDYDYGTAYWDQLVFRFIPAQLIGKDLKDKLMFDNTGGDAGGEDDETEIGIRSFKRIKGSTVTGIGDSFKQFGYLGFLFFVLMAILFRSLWVTSLQPGAFFAKLLYIQTSIGAMRAVTHQTVDFPPSVIYNTVFLGLAVLYARMPRKQGLGARSSGKINPPAPPVPKAPTASPKAVTFSREKKPIENLFED